jgi:hypothetical protein
MKLLSLSSLINPGYNGKRCFLVEVTKMELNEMRQELGTTAKRLADIRGSL